MQRPADSQNGAPDSQSGIPYIPSNTPHNPSGAPDSHSGAPDSQSGAYSLHRVPHMHALPNTHRSSQPYTPN